MLFRSLRPRLCKTQTAVATGPSPRGAFGSGTTAPARRTVAGVPGLVLAAEHGALLRTSAGWESARPEASTGWKQTVRPILEQFVNRTPGSFVEEKEYALVWHYRMAEPEFASWLANELVAMLESRLAQTDLRAVRGQKIVEVKPIWANKGMLLDRLAALCPDPGFHFAMGDDRTDEDLFARLPETAWTVRVGRGETRARCTVADPAAARQALARLAGPEPPHRVRTL